MVDAQIYLYAEILQNYIIWNFCLHLKCYSKADHLKIPMIVIFHISLKSQSPISLM